MQTCPRFPRAGLAPVLAIAMLALGGCFSAGPDYRRPETPPPDRWTADLTNGLSASPATPQALSEWWTVLRDDVLTNLMTRARLGNLDARQARARVLEARAQRGVAESGSYPSLGTAASAKRTRGSTEAGGGQTRNAFSHGLDASWELDLFGKNRRAAEAATASLEASRADLSDVLVSLFGEVALNYVAVRSSQTRLQLTETNLAAQVESYDLARWRRDAGLSTQLDVDQARLSLEQTRAQIPTLQIAREKACHRLAVLLGMPPGSLNDLLSVPRPIPTSSAAVAVGVPADALRRRPDVRRAERQLAAQTALVGVATADRYPSFSLLGSIGLESLTLGNLYTAGARTAQGAANASWTLFDGGRLRHTVEVRSAQQEQALGQYEASVLAALEEVENALIAYAGEQNRRAALLEATRAAQSAFSLARDQYASGLIDFQVVLDSQRSLLSVQDQLAVSEADVTSELIRLYKALGGGWSPMPAEAAPASPQPEGKP